MKCVMALKDVSYISLALFFLICSLHCDAETHITYEFPTDSCNQGSYPVDENKVIHVKFNGGYMGGPSCRQMTFKLKKSFLYRYRTCVRLLYIKSPKCRIKVDVHQPFRDYSGYYSSDTIMSENCWGNSYYHYMYDRCFDTGQITFGLYNNYSADRGGNPRNIAPNSTFEFKLETRKEIDGETVGIIAGVSAGVIIALVASVCIIIWCKRRKQRARNYCNACTPNPFTSETLRYKLSEGLSAEFAVAGFLICSCICCRGKRQQAEEPTKTSRQLNINLTHQQTTESSFEEDITEPDVPLLQ